VADSMGYPFHLRASRVGETRVGNFTSEPQPWLPTTSADSDQQRSFKCVSSRDWRARYASCQKYRII